MNRSHFVLLFVSCIVLMVFLDAQDISSLIELLTLHPMDYLVVLIGAFFFFLLLLPLMLLSHKLIFSPQKIEAAGKRESVPRI